MNLSETQQFTQKALIAIIIITAIYYTGKFLLFQGISAYQSLFPAKIPEPEAAFKILPKLQMANISLSGNPIFVLDTENGSLPALPDRAKVYKFKQPQVNLLSEQKIKVLAQDLGFTGSFTKVTTSDFRWIDGTNSRTFEANAITRNFELMTSINKISTILRTTITSEDATSKVSGFIKSKGLASAAGEELDYEAIPTQITLGRFNEISRIPTPARIIKVNVNRSFVAKPSKTLPSQSAKEFKILGPQPYNSLTHFYTTNNNDLFRFPIIEWTYWEVDYTFNSEYYLSSLPDVWKAVQSGQGVVVHLEPSNVGHYFDPQVTTLSLNRIEIKDIYLAYYEPRELSEYLQPIYVFEGQFFTNPNPGQLSEDGEIVIYYPAARGDFVVSTQAPASTVKTPTSAGTFFPAVNPVQDLIPETNTNNDDTGITAN